MPRAVHERPATAVLPCCLLALTMATPLAAEDELKGIKLIPENVSLLDESFAWDKSIEARTGVGYKDNVLLRHDNPAGSPFVASGLELSVIRLPLDGLRFYFFLNAEDLRYWHQVGVDKEETVLVDSEARKDLDEHWKIGAGLQYAYLNQVLDVSTIESGLSTAQVQGHGLTLRPFLRNELGTGTWLQFELPITRQFLKSPLDNYWQYGAKFILGQDFGRQSELTLSYTTSTLLYDTRVQFGAGGFEIPGAPLELSQYKAELAWQHHWDAARHWRSTTKLLFDYNQDNGSGFFNYYQYEVSEQLRYQNAGWEIRAKAGAAYYHFPVQTANLTNVLNAPSLSKTTAFVNLRVERKIATFLKVFAEYENEHSLSNDPFDRYRVNTVSGGLEWLF